MPALTTSVDFARPPEEVYAYVTEPARFGEWQANVTSGHMESGLAHDPGARCSTTCKTGFVEREVTSEVTHADRRGVGAHAASMTPSAPWSMSPSSRSTKVERHGGRLASTFRGTASELLVTLTVRPQPRKEMPANLGRLKHRVEAQPAR